MGSEMCIRDRHRTGQAHVTILLPHCRQPPATPDSWVDLYVSKTEAAALAKAKTFKAGKIF